MNTASPHQVRAQAEAIARHLREAADAIEQQARADIAACAEEDVEDLHLIDMQTFSGWLVCGVYALGYSRGWCDQEAIERQNRRSKREPELTLPLEVAE